MGFVLALCISYVAFCIGTHPTGPLTTPDSYNYLQASPIYPIGYPLFLKVFNPDAAIIVQPILFGAALALLGGQIVRHTRSTLLAVATLAAIIALPQLREFHASILSESLFGTLLIVFLALSVRFAYHPTWHLMVLMAFTAGVGGTVRRTAYALVPVMLIMVLQQRHRLHRSHPTFFLVAAVAPFLAIAGTEQVIAPLLHGGHTSSLMGRHMFAKAALIDAPPAPIVNDPLTDTLNRHLEHDYAPVRNALAQAPRDVRAVLSLYYETCMQGGCVDGSRALMPDLVEADQTRRLGNVGVARLRRAPIAYLDLAALNYQALWTVDRLRDPSRAAAMAAFLDSHRPLLFEQMAMALQPGQPMTFQPSPRVRYAQWFMTMLGFGTAAIAMVGLLGTLSARPLPPLATIGSVAALAAHGSLVLTTLLAAGFSRFLQGVWPAIAMAAVFGAWAVWESVRRRPA